MSRHQIIYTSCKRGITGTNDGQQIFSFDRNFENYSDKTITSLFSYNVPKQKKDDKGNIQPIIMTEELARTMPQAFIYRAVDKENCAVALNTYLGRDYMGSSGRFGNVLSHVILFGREESSQYPCEYFGSEMLRDHMKFEEVNNPERPEYLDEPVLQKGSIVNVENIRIFLNENNNIKIFEHMLSAFIRAKADKKRVLICDKRENIIKWIAALEYVFPVENIIDVNFTTYEFNPESSQSLICGVEEVGTKFDSSASEKYYIFDLINDNYPQMDVSHKFFDFISASFQFSPNNFERFHGFLRGYSWKEADETVLDAYCLYSIFDTDIDNIGRDIFYAGGNFLTQYGSDKEKKRFFDCLADEVENICDQDKAYYIDILKYVVDNLSFDEITGRMLVKNLAMDRLAEDFQYSSEDGFNEVYKAISELCALADISIISEINEEKYYKHLISLLNFGSDIWKLDFAIKSIIVYIKEKNLTGEAFYINSPQGRLLESLFEYVLINIKTEINRIIHILFDAFKAEDELITDIAFGLDEILTKLEAPYDIKENIWSNFRECVYENCSKYLEKIINVLVERNYFDQVYNLFLLFLNSEQSVDKRFNLLKQFFPLFMTDKDNFKYRDNIFNEYYNSVFKFDGDKLAQKAYELYKIITQYNLRYDFIGNLICIMEESIHLVPFGNMDIEYIDIIVNFCDKERISYSHKIRVILLGLYIQETMSMMEVRECIKSFTKDMKSTKIDITVFEKKNVAAYFRWIIKNICRYAGEEEDIAFNEVLKLFLPPKDLLELFCNECTKYYFDIYKSAKDTDIFKYYIRFITGVFTYDENKLKEIGEQLMLVGKKNMNRIDKTMEEFFADDPQRLELWHIMSGSSEESSNIKKVFGSLLGKFKINKQ